MKNIVQTLPYEVFNEAEKINQLFEAGLETLHIRKPMYSYQELSLLLEAINIEFHHKIVIHSKFSLLSQYNLKGIHTNLSQLSSFVKRTYFTLLKKRYNISLSVSVSNFKAKEIEEKLIDYVFVAPVFQKFSEEHVVQKINMFEHKRALKNTSKAVFAHECFSLENIFAIKACGFSGAVLQSYIWKSEDILNAFKTQKLNVLGVEKNEAIKKLAV